MLRFAILLVVLSCGSLFNAAAQKPAAKPAAQAKKQPCADAQTQSEMNQCAYEEYKKADAELNKTYQQLLPKLEAARQERLKTAQRAWIAFRDADCEYEAAEYEGGSMQPLIRYSCLESATRNRTAQLRGFLKDLNSR
jgi:uncharacterized protein YecT (DUF1311 family)